MGLVGLIVGVLVDEVFGGVNFEFTPYISIVFVIITMGAFILHSIEKKSEKVRVAGEAAPGLLLQRRYYSTHATGMEKIKY